MGLNRTQLKILSILEKSSPMDRKALFFESGLPACSFRGRLSELRKKGLIDYNKEKVWLKKTSNKTIIPEKEDNTYSFKKQKYDFNSLTSIKEPNNLINRKLTIVLSDLHLGDKNVMINTYKSTISNLLNKIALLSTEGPFDTITVILNGDAVSGRNIFRGQEAQNIFNKGNMQILYASAYLYQLNEQLEQYANVEWFIIKGNHDQYSGDNYAWLLADKLRALGLDAFYAGHEFITNLGNTEKQHWALIEHGYGGGSYYPLSYEFIRQSTKKVIETNMRQWEQGLGPIERVIVGHTHWLNTNFQQDLRWAFDVSGGFQKNNRVELGMNQRPPGVLLYAFDSNKEGLSIYDWKGGLRLFEIPPDGEVLYNEIHDPALTLNNHSDVASVLANFYKFLVEKGLVKYFE